MDEAMRSLERLRQKVLGDDKPSKRGGVPHNHAEFVEGCFRCDLSRDEV